MEEGFSFGIALFYLTLVVVVIAGMWKTFEKAGQPGWGCLIPFYNVYLMVQIAQRPGSWFLLMLIPIVNVFISIQLCLDIARNFGKDPLFGVGLWLLSPIFYPILGFGDAVYLEEEYDIEQRIEEMGEEEF